jgi:catechol 2,3-dioxygenase-like lactoylglutathione lyase family enzyme
MPEQKRLRLIQVALSSTHLRRTHDWYCQALGFVPAGPFRHREVPGRGLVSGLPEAALDVWCVMGGLDWMQFEIIEFQKPRMRPMPDDWRPSDIGYSTVGMTVNDFDEAMRRIRRTSGRLLSAPLGPRGDRRVCLRDPDGVLLEIRERLCSPLPETPSARPHQPAVRFVTLSVPDLNEARRFWADGIGLSEIDACLHLPEDEALWGLPGAARKTALFAAGSAFVELVEYVSPPGRSRPAGYLLSDQGILNVALGTGDEGLFLETYERVIRAGYKANSQPWSADGATVVYVHDGSGTSVELLYVSPDGMETMGFVPDCIASAETWP